MKPWKEYYAEIAKAVWHKQEETGEQDPAGSEMEMLNQVNLVKPMLARDGFKYAFKAERLPDGSVRCIFTPQDPEELLVLVANGNIEVYDPKPPCVFRPSCEPMYKFGLFGGMKRPNKDLIALIRIRPFEDYYKCTTLDAAVAVAMQGLDLGGEIAIAELLDKKELPFS